MDYPCQWRPPPKHAFFSGYYIKYAAFQQLALAVDPSLSATLAETHDGRLVYSAYVFAFEGWAGRLPRDERRKVPVLKVFEKNQDDFNPDDKLLFFPTRFLAANKGKDSKITDHPGLLRENDKDRARRDQFIAFVRERTRIGSGSATEGREGKDDDGFVLDEASFQFGCVRDVHPYYDKLVGFPQAPPKQAFFSGYYIKYPAFKQLALALDPSLSPMLENNDGRLVYEAYVFAFDGWRWRLPEDQRQKVPLIKIFRRNQDDFNPDDKLIFFPTRYVPAPKGKDSKKKDFPHMLRENDRDRACRDQLIAVVRERVRTGAGGDEGYVLDEASLVFGCVRDKHPFYDEFTGL